jgi:RNA polymerase sigma-70 factor (ECF subfamily)
VNESQVGHERLELLIGIGAVPPPIPQGQPSAAMPPFRAIYEEYFDFVWRCARALGVTADVMDDAVQEIFLVVYTKVHTLNQPSALRSWIYGVTRRIAADYRRSRRVEDVATEPSSVTLEVEATAPTPMEAASLHEDVRLLQRLLSKLDPLKRETFILAELMGMTGVEIAEATQVPLNTAYSRLRVARAEFEKALAAEQRSVAQSA